MRVMDTRYENREAVAVTDELSEAMQNSTQTITLPDGTVMEGYVFGGAGMRMFEEQYFYSNDKFYRLVFWGAEDDAHPTGAYEVEEWAVVE